MSGSDYLALIIVCMALVVFCGLLLAIWSKQAADEHDEATRKEIRANLREWKL